MKKLLFCISFAVALGFAGCNKAAIIITPAADFQELEQTVITDFTNHVALGSYLQLSVAAASLNTSLQALSNSSTASNLETAREGWRNMRLIWEQCESFLFGPVEDYDYDPKMDTWPTDYVQMDSLLASSHPLDEGSVQNLTLSLRGYHPIEYIIFGDHGSRAAADITPRQKEYMSGLARDLLNTCNALYLSWAGAPENFAQQVITAGNGSTKFASRKEVFIALAGGLIDICEEVGEGKMKEPFDTKDPAIVESPYSGNSMTDFKNNIIGIQNVYMGINGGKGLHDLVAAKNKSLDNTIQTKITAAINSFDNVTVNFEDAIITQRVQLQQTMTALGDLKEILEEDLVSFIQVNIMD